MLHPFENLCIRDDHVAQEEDTSAPAVPPAPATPCCRAYRVGFQSAHSTPAKCPPTAAQFPLTPLGAHAGELPAGEMPEGPGIHSDPTYPQ